MKSEHKDPDKSSSIDSERQPGATTVATVATVATQTSWLSEFDQLQREIAHRYWEILMNKDGQ